jgi:Protein of unknown function (DUF2510)
MDPARGSGHSPQPSESLCEIALALAREIDDYERAGGRDIVGDVVTREPYRSYFDPHVSNTGRERPGWRWDVVLRDATHTDTVVGEPNGGWRVAGVVSLRGMVQRSDGGDVTLDAHGAEEGLKPPMPDTDSPANRALIGGATGGGLAAGGLLGAVAGRWLGRRTAVVRSPAWHPDPGGRHVLRYWNGVRWTRFVYTIANASDDVDEPDGPGKGREPFGHDTRTRPSTVGVSRAWGGRA